MLVSIMSFMILVFFSGSFGWVVVMQLWFELSRDGNEDGGGVVGLGF